MDITELLTFGVANKASDMHLSSGLPPMLRVNGEIRKVNLPPLDSAEVKNMVYDIMNDNIKFLNKTWRLTLRLRFLMYRVFGRIFLCKLGE